MRVLEDKRVLILILYILVYKFYLNHIENNFFIQFIV